MGKSNTFENEWLDHVLRNATIPNIGDATGLRGSTAAGNVYLALHTADPGEAGDQTTSEATYTSYARTALSRDTAGTPAFGAAASGAASNAILIQCPQCTGGSNNISHWSIGVASGGASKILYRGCIGGTPIAFTGKASDDIVRIPGHTFVVDDRIVFAADPSGGLPTGITEGTIYWVKTVSGNDITLSTTQGGATLDLTADGSGMVAEVTILAVSNLIRPEFAIGQLVCRET